MNKDRRSRGSEDQDSEVLRYFYSNSVGSKHKTKAYLCGKTRSFTNNIAERQNLRVIRNERKVAKTESNHCINWNQICTQKTIFRPKSRKDRIKPLHQLKPNTYTENNLQTEKSQRQNQTTASIETKYARRKQSSDRKVAKTESNHCINKNQIRTQKTIFRQRT